MKRNYSSKTSESSPGLRPEFGVKMICSFLLKGFLTSMIVLFSISIVQAATYYTRQNGNWNATTTWSTASCGGAAASAYPVAGDIVNICAGHTVTVTADAACADLTIAATGTANGVTISGTNTLTVSATITMHAVTAAVTSALSVGTGTLNFDSISMQGHNCGGTPCSYLTNLTVSTGTINCRVIYFNNTSANERDQSNVIITGAGTINITGNFGVQPGDDKSLGGRYDPQVDGATMNCHGTTPQKLGSYTWKKLKINNTAGVTFTGGFLTDLIIGETIPNSLFIDGGLNHNYNVGYPVGCTLNLISGTYKTQRTESSAAFIFGTTNISPGTTVEYYGTGAQPVALDDYANLTISGARAANSVTLPSSGTVGVSGDYLITATFTSGNLVTTGSTVNFNGTGAQTINSGGKSFNHFTISNPSGICTASTNGITVLGTYTTAAGSTLDMGTNLLSVGTSVSHLGTLMTQNAATTPITTGKTWGGTVIYNKSDGGQTVVAGTYNDLIMGNTSGLQTVAGNILVKHALDVGSGGNLTNPSGKTVTVGQ